MGVYERSAEKLPQGVCCPPPRRVSSTLASPVPPLPLPGLAAHSSAVAAEPGAWELVPVAAARATAKTLSRRTAARSRGRGSVPGCSKVPPPALPCWEQGSEGLSWPSDRQSRHGARRRPSWSLPKWTVERSASCGTSGAVVGGETACENRRAAGGDDGDGRKGGSSANLSWKSCLSIPLNILSAYTIWSPNTQASQNNSHGTRKKRVQQQKTNQNGSGFADT